MASILDFFKPQQPGEADKQSVLSMAMTPDEGKALKTYLDKVVAAQIKQLESATDRQLDKILAIIDQRSAKAKQSVKRFLTIAGIMLFALLVISVLFAITTRSNHNGSKR